MLLGLQLSLPSYHHLWSVMCDVHVQMGTRLFSPSFTIEPVDYLTRTYLLRRVEERYIIVSLVCCCHHDHNHHRLCATRRLAMEKVEDPSSVGTNGIITSQNKKNMNTNFISDCEELNEVSCSESAMKRFPSAPIPFRLFSNTTVKTCQSKVKQRIQRKVRPPTMLLFY